MLVKEIMSPFVATISENAGLKEAAREMHERDIGCLLVSENDWLTGIVTDRDITCKGVADGMDIDAMIVRDVMSKDITWCRENEDIEDAIRLMEKRQVRRLPVLDDEKNLVGILTVGDISTQLSHELSGEVIEAVSMSSHNKYPVSVS